jgi:hypothetical protein
VARVGDSDDPRPKSAARWPTLLAGTDAARAQRPTANGVDTLSDIQPLAYHNLIVGMKSEVHA